METRTYAERVAAEVRASLARSGIAQSALSEVAGISPASLSRKLKGRYPFDAAELIAIAPHIGTTATAIMAAAEAVGAPATEQAAS